ncbi:hypothetical protein [Glycomyces sp. MUSA5-2]|uniref:hypothetical protein n=1 Tax=Glycomyces sp. MUSA5-2 TaxID=2053002 RepID=UPI0030096E6E
MSDPSVGNHFHGNTVIGIQNTGGTIHNVQVNQQRAQAGTRTSTQEAAAVLEELIRRIQEAQHRGEIAAEDAEDAVTIIANAPADAENEESRSRLIRLIKRAGNIVNGCASTVKAVTAAADAIKAIGQ